jgi:hypothetical protein
MKKSLLFGLLIIMIGCTDTQVNTSSDEEMKTSIQTDTRVDTSSNEKMKTSIQEVRASLPEEKREQFDEALRILRLKAGNISIIASPESMRSPMARLKDAIKGKTGAEIIAAAEQIEKERYERERQRALRENRALQEKKANLKKLAKFKVNRSQFYMQKMDFGTDQPIIELDVVNNTAYPVSRAYFRGTLASPGRAVPWHRDEFIFKIPGGLEPGEDAHWKLALNMFGDWGKIDAPEDAFFTVEVIRLDGADDKPIYPADFYSKLDAEYLIVMRMAEEVWQPTYVPRTIVNAPWGDEPHEFGFFGSPQPHGPGFFTLDKDGNIYIRDHEHDAIKVFDKNGVFLRSAPTWFGLYFTRFAVGDNGHIYGFGGVGVGGGPFIYELFPSGKLLKKHQISGSIPSGGSGQGVMIDKKGNLFFNNRQTYFHIGKVLKDRFEMLPHKMQADSAKKGFLNSNKNYRIIVNNKRGGSPNFQIIQAEDVAGNASEVQIVMDKGVQTKRKEVKFLGGEGIVLKQVPIECLDASLEFLHQDKNNYIYIRVHRLRDLQVWKYDEEGNIVAQIVLPWKQYGETPIRGIVVDDDGNIYYLLNVAEGSKIIKWEQKQ